MRVRECMRVRMSTISRLQHTHMSFYVVHVFTASVSTRLGAHTHQSSHVT